jgi:hypothetical protein
MEDDMNNEVPDGTPNILIPFDGVENWDGVLKSRGKPKGDHPTHFKGWIEKPIIWNSIF